MTKICIQVKTMCENKSGRAEKIIYKIIYRNGPVRDVPDKQVVGKSGRKRKNPWRSKL